MGGQAIVFLTHVESERIFRHFVRLREETKGLLSPILCIHDPVRSAAKRVLARIRGNIPTPHIRVDAKIGARLLPNRYAQMQRLGRWYNTGFTDLAYVPALLSGRLREYDFVWCMENDVDYAGSWRDFFGSAMEKQADLLSTYIYPRNQNINWQHWSWFKTPPEVPFYQHTSSFNSIVRFSRRMLSTYVKSVQNDLWQGHTEALWPTIAQHNGLTICDMGGMGPFCPESWLDKHYSNPSIEGWDNLEPGRGDLPYLAEQPFWLCNGKEGQQSAETRGGSTRGSNVSDKVTFICGPPTVQSAYFHEDPTRFLVRDVLYHPVKAGWTKTSQHHSSFSALKRHLRPLKKTALQYWLKSS